MKGRLVVPGLRAAGVTVSFLRAADEGSCALLVTCGRRAAQTARLLLPHLWHARRKGFATRKTPRALGIPSEPLRFEKPKISKEKAILNRYQPSSIHTHNVETM
eukprot:2438749-Prymnesium_polylepis.1